MGKKSEPRDPFWWSAVLATRAAFAARPRALGRSHHGIRGSSGFRASSH
jgi:hypothetical protein